MKTQKSVVVIGIALVIAVGVMLNVRPKKHAVAAPLLSSVALETQTAEAANPCSMTTVCASAGADCYLRGGTLPTNIEVPYEDGWSFQGDYSAGCALWGGFTVAVLRSYIWYHPTNQTGYWTNDGSWPIHLNQGCESTSGILHAWHEADCSAAYALYSKIQGDYCPCK